MQVSARVDLATRVLVDLARAESPRTCRQLSLRAGVPASTLAGLLNDLHRAGIVHSRRGRLGGYTLQRAPEATSVAEVLRALDDIDVPFDPVSPLARVWNRLHRTVVVAADGVTIADLAEMT